MKLDFIALSRICSAAFLFLPACQTARTAAPTNITDFLVKQHRLENQQVTTASDFYHAVGRRILYSQCKWLPSDSEYYNLMARACGPVRGMYQAIAGFLEEPDLGSDSSQSVVFYQGRLRWLRSVGDCTP